MCRPQRVADLVVAAGLVLAVAGCADSRVIHRQAEQTYEHLASGIGADRLPQEVSPTRHALPVAAPDRDAARSRETKPATMVLYFAPETEADAKAAGVARPSAPESSREARSAPAEFEPIEGMTFGEILKEDLQATPGKLWSGTKLSFANPTNIAILTAVFGVDRIVRNNADDRARHYTHDNKTSLDETRDFGEIVGHPGLHFAAAAAWYLASVDARDAKNHELSKVLIEALAINGLTTQVLQMSVNQHDPSGDRYGWPSGHTSSSFCVASVLHEYYGWQVGAPAYLVSGYIAATRVGDRKHNISDVIFGAALGVVIGHSIVKGELPQVAGFTVLPYGGLDAAGVMLVRSW